MLDEILGRLESVGLFVAAHRCIFFARELVSYGNVYSDGDRSHEPLAFLSGSFKGTHLRWATVDREGFAIVNTFRRLEYLFWGGVHIFTDHRNVTYIFSPDACVTSVTKAMAQRLEN